MELGAWVLKSLLIINLFNPALALDNLKLEILNFKLTQWLK
jgi:hypothetical protein